MKKQLQQLKQQQKKNRKLIKELQQELEHKNQQLNKSRETLKIVKDLADGLERIIMGACV